MTVASFSVPMGQVHVQKTKDLLICAGLGSCLGVVAFDAQARISGAATVMLPESLGTGGETPGRFANTAIPALIELMEQQGADRNRLQIAIAGGAQVFRTNKETPGHLDIGNRNTMAVLKQLEALGIVCAAQSTGGDLARTLVLEPATGAVRVKTALTGERLLCNFGA